MCSSFFFFFFKKEWTLSFSIHVIVAGILLFFFLRWSSNLNNKTDLITFKQGMKCNSLLSTLLLLATNYRRIRDKYVVLSYAKKLKNKGSIIQVQHITNYQEQSQNFHVCSSKKNKKTAISLQSHSFQFK